MQLRPQDIVVILKLVAGGANPWSYAGLGEALGMSASNVFNSIARAQAARLVDTFQVSRSPGNKGPGFLPEPKGTNLKEFLIHGVKYAFPVERGGPTRGVLTAEAAAPLNRFFSDQFTLPPVWPHPMGLSRGIAFSPLYKSVPEVVLRDSNSNRKFYELLALVDAIREGRAREREIAIRELSARIDGAQTKSE